MTTSTFTGRINIGNVICVRQSHLYKRGSNSAPGIFFWAISDFYPCFGGGFYPSFGPPKIAVVAYGWVTGGGGGDGGGCWPGPNPPLLPTSDFVPRIERWGPRDRRVM